jgi:hypothetical protein
VTIVGYHDGSSNLTVSGQLANVTLPPVLEHYQTNETANLLRKPDVTLSGNAFTVMLPPDTLFTISTPLPPQNSTFLRGDANGDDVVDVSDPLFTLFYLFQGKSAGCLDALDANDDGDVGVTDVIYVLQFLFRDGPAPALPFPGAGIDMTLDTLGCSR